MFDPEGHSALVLDLRTGTWLHLNEAAAAFLRQIARGCGTRQAIAVLAEDFGVPAQRLADDMAPLIESLVRRRLLERL
ncbi:PqqD family protein [Streptomyces specialis]|uniref:PqqD family protein n=1 Tax=Streptomyces specialis TaxID=498367 RepID=UPI00073E5E20|nr:PqqD family protein [Streptomyces specialis]